MNPIFTSLLLGLTAALANIFGGAIIVQRNWERAYLRYFVALGAGFMLATSIVEMVPESLERGGRYAAFLVLLGYLIVHFFEHTVTPHFHFGEETHQDEFVHPHKGYSVLMGLLIHTFFDGIAIASGFLVSNWLGWIIFLAVFLHKIPDGFTVASIFVSSGHSASRALAAAMALGVSTIIGVFAIHLFGDLWSHSLLGLLKGKDVLVGAVDVATDAVETPAEVAATIRRVLPYVPPERLYPCTNCGMVPLARDVAGGKLRALVAGAALVRRELGAT